MVVNGGAKRRPCEASSPLFDNVSQCVGGITKRHVATTARH